MYTYVLYRLFLAKCSQQFFYTHPTLYRFKELKMFQLFLKFNDKMDWKSQDLRGNCFIPEFLGTPALLDTFRLLVPLLLYQKRRIQIQIYSYGKILSNIILKYNLGLKKRRMVSLSSSLIVRFLSSRKSTNI